MNDRSHWTFVCAQSEILPETGVCARVEGAQVAVFAVRDAVHAIGNLDPASDANVLSRGLVGDIGGEIVVASPIYKNHYSLISGRCLEDADLAVPVYRVRIIEGQVWVRNRPVSMERPAGARRLVVIGNGVSSIRVLEELLGLAPNAYRICVFGSEPHATYNRTLLSPLLAGDRQRTELYTHDPAWFEKAGIELHLGETVTRIDRVHREVHTASGLRTAYDRLLVATGSKPVVPEVPGIELAGVRTFRDVGDLEALLAESRHGGRALVIGGGLLGVETAAALQSRGMQTAILDRESQLMSRQLDPAAASMLCSELAQRGIDVYLDAQLEVILGEQRVSAARLRDGRELAVDLIVVAIGTRPRTTLASQAGIPCDRGILVDDTMLTFDPAIYAVGECVQHRNSVYGLVAPLLEQATVCATHLAERGRRRYLGSEVSTQLRVAGIEVFSAGNFRGGHDCESLVMRDTSRKVYRRLVVRDGRLVGAVLYGDIQDNSYYFELIREGVDIGAFRSQLMFGRSACAEVA